MSPHWKSNAYVAACALCLGLSVYHYHRASPQTEPVPEKSISSPSRERSASLPKWSDVTAAKLPDAAVSVYFSQRPEDITALAQRLAELSWDDISQISRALRHHLEADPQAGADFLKRLCHELAPQNPENALELAYSLSQLPTVTSLERSMLQAWAQTDPNKIFQAATQRGDRFNVHHLSMLSSLAQNERPELLPKMIAWADRLAAEKTPGDQDARALLVGEIATKLSMHVNPATLPQVTDFLVAHVDNPLAAATLANIAPQYVMHKPEEGMAWLDSIPADNATRSLIFGSAMEGLAKAKPAEAAQMLNAEYFLDRYYRPESPTETPEQATANKHKFFDEMLNNYIRSTIREDPQSAYENAHVFFDASLRKDIQTWATELMPELAAHDAVPKSTR